MQQYNIVKQAFLNHLQDKYNIPAEMATLMFRDELIKLAAMTFK